MDTVWTTLPRLTPSSCGDLDCSRKYTELRIKKHWPKGRQMPASVPRGTAIHDALRVLHAARWEGNLPMGDLDAIARRAVYSARFGSNADRDRETHLVADAVRLFCDNQDPEDISAIIALETQIEFDYRYKGEGLACICSTIDRALVRPDDPTRLVVQDYKTTSQRIDLRECFLVLWCARQKWPAYKSYALELIWIDLEERQVTVDVIEGKHVKGQIRLLTDALIRVLHTDPVPEPGQSCVFCPFRTPCQGLPGVNLGEDAEVF